MVPVAAQMCVVAGNLTLLLEAHAFPSGKGTPLPDVVVSDRSSFSSPCLFFFLLFFFLHWLAMGTYIFQAVYPLSHWRCLRGLRLTISKRSASPIERCAYYVVNLNVLIFPVCVRSNVVVALCVVREAWNSSEFALRWRGAIFGGRVWALSRRVRALTVLKLITPQPVAKGCVESAR